VILNHFNFKQISTSYLRQSKLILSLLVAEETTMAVKNLFASKSIPEHIVRGAVGFASLAAAAWVLTYPGLMPLLWAVGFGGVSLVALRGCPVCWTIGLMNTFLNTSLKSKACASCDDISLRNN
jgi:hypothetical protein